MEWFQNQWILAFSQFLLAVFSSGCGITNDMGWYFFLNVKHFRAHFCFHDCFKSWQAALCSVVRPLAACMVSVKEQPGGVAHSLQTDLDGLWLDSRYLSLLSSPSIFHSPALTDMSDQCAFVPSLRSFCLSILFAHLSHFLLHTRTKIFVTLHWFLSAFSSLSHVLLFLVCLPFFSLKIKMSNEPN